MTRSSCAARVAARLWFALVLWMVGGFGGGGLDATAAALLPQDCVVAAAGVGPQGACASPEAPAPTSIGASADAPTGDSRDDRIESIDDEGRSQNAPDGHGQRRRLAAPSSGPEPDTADLRRELPPPRG